MQGKEQPLKQRTGENRSIFLALEELSKSDIYPFHMPGHKRHMKGHLLEQAYKMDITEIEGFDNLHQPQGLILDAMTRARKLYGTKETFFLINGSTAGILAAVHACVPYGGKIIVSRNSHQSVYNAISLLGLDAIYLYPTQISGWDMAAGISTAEVEEVIKKNPDAKVVLITSPTYEGFTSPIQEIANLAHEAGIPLIVDEAHGAHFPFSDEFPESSISQGADLVIHSLHKTMPAFTQTALLHLQGDLVQLREVQRYLSVFQSSSPSYLLMGGIDYCLRLVEEEQDRLWREILTRIEAFSEKMQKLKYIRVWSGRKANEKVEKDPLKLILKPVSSYKDEKPYTAAELYRELLRKYRLQMEMVTSAFVLGIITCMDDDAGLSRLEKALAEIDKSLRPFPQKVSEKKNPRGKADDPVKEAAEWADADKKEHPQQLVNLTAEPIGEAIKKEIEWIPVNLSVGRESADYINLYPPGIPLIVPGEVISQDLVDTLLAYQDQDLPLQGLKDNRISVVKAKKTALESKS